MQKGWQANTDTGMAAALLMVPYSRKWRSFPSCSNGTFAVFR